MYYAAVNSNTHNISFWGKFIVTTYLQIIHYMCMVRLQNLYANNYTTYRSTFFIIFTTTIITVLHLSDIISVLSSDIKY